MSEHETVTIQGSRWADYQTVTDTAIGHFKKAMQKDGIEVTDEDALRYMGWCYETAWTSVQKSVPPQVGEHMEVIVEGVSKWCSNQYRMHRTGQFPPPKGRRWAVPPPPPAPTVPTQQHHHSGYL